MWAVKSFENEYFFPIYDWSSLDFMIFSLTNREIAWTELQYHTKNVHWKSLGCFQPSWDGGSSVGVWQALCVWLNQPLGMNERQAKAAAAAAAATAAAQKPMTHRRVWSAWGGRGFSGCERGTAVVFGPNRGVRLSPVRLPVYAQMNSTEREKKRMEKLLRLPAWHN